MKEKRIIKDENVKKAIIKLYVLAASQQALKDVRICSPRMKEIHELKEWWLDNETK